MQWWITPGKRELERSVFLGILNITPDSFSDGGRHFAPGAAEEQAKRLLEDGADILDLGAESTRPGAALVAPEEEWARLRPVLDVLQRQLPTAVLSLDTRHPSVARQGLERGMAILNDISGFSDPAMLALAQESSCGLIAMRSRILDGRLHMPAYHETGHSIPDRAIEELRAILQRLLGAGIAAERILLDPGFGFGTVFSEDLALWQALPLLPKALDWPVQRFCLGVSRKRFLARRAGVPDLPPEQRDELTRQAHTEAMSLGYRIFRTHAVNRSSNKDHP
jgi:dihydropteroate synthase